MTSGAPGVADRALFPVYRELWDRVETCSGLSGKMSRVQWFVVPGYEIECNGLSCSGLWVSPHKIYLSESIVHDSLRDYSTVRHEILHDLLQRPGHPAQFEKCGLSPSDGSATIRSPQRS